tara:strand:- start:65 stop:394 length:330 start_codon:yes stop_codon:yes gene_type:complete
VQFKVNSKLGYKLDKNTPPMEREIKYLLYDLCVKWGFCIPPEDNDWISQETYWTAKDFAKAVVEADGLDPNTDTSWVNKISTIFQERFGNIQIEENSFTDRTRGVKESW